MRLHVDKCLESALLILQIGHMNELLCAIFEIEKMEPEVLQFDTVGFVLLPLSFV